MLTIHLDCMAAHEGSWNGQGDSWWIILLAHERQHLERLVAPFSSGGGWSTGGHFVSCTSDFADGPLVTACWWWRSRSHYHHSKKKKCSCFHLFTTWYLMGAKVHVHAPWRGSLTPWQLYPDSLRVPLEFLSLCWTSYFKSPTAPSPPPISRC